MSVKWKASRDKGNGTDADLSRVSRVPAHLDTMAVYADEGEISLYDIWRVLGKYKVMVLGIMLLAALLSYLAALWMTPVYRAEVLLAPVTDLDGGDSYLSPFKDFGNIASLAGINLNRRDRKSESIATLKSRKFSEQFIQDNKLNRLFFSDLWDEKEQRWEVDDDRDIPTLWDAYELFDDNIRHIREDRSTGLVTLSIEWEDPETAAQWANELVSSVNATLRQQAVEASNQAITYLQEQLGHTSVVDLQQVLHRLIEAEMKKIILANINEEFAFKVIDPATAPDEAYKPRVGLMVILSTTSGLIFGIILALVLNALRGGIGFVGNNAGEN
jgi:LPS O-antigen subunit length determinant protein (WzzB/FepE family)